MKKILFKAMLPVIIAIFVIAAQVPAASLAAEMPGDSTWTMVSPMSKPTVITKPAPGTGVFVGEVTSDGGSAIIDHGFYYGFSPTNLSGKASLGRKFEPGTFSYSVYVIAIYPPPTIYYQAYATNSMGTTYGAILCYPDYSKNPGSSILPIKTIIR